MPEANLTFINKMENKDNQTNKKKKSRSKEYWHRFWATIVILSIFFLIALTIIYSNQCNEKDLYTLDFGVSEVAINDSIKAKVTGVLLFRDSILPERNIIITLKKGNRSEYVEMLKTDSLGYFSTTCCFADTIYNDTTTQARLSVKVFCHDNEFIEKHYRFNTGTIGERAIDVDLKFPIIIVLVFVLSILIPFLILKPSWKFLFSITLAFVFSFAMITAVAIGLHYLNKTADKDDLLTLGFASVFHERYVENDSEEWILSFTSRYKDSEKDIVKGFGAPLWVLFLSVIGSGIYTITLICNSIVKRPKFAQINENFLEQKNEPFGEEVIHVNDTKGNNTANENEKSQLGIFRTFQNEIIKHQMYILLSPISSIFVYQTIVVTGAGASTIVVALAALGSGLTFNIILNKAIKLAKDSMSTSK